MESDAELIARSLKGDDNAFVMVVDRHASAVAAYLGRRAGNAAAEDLLADVWVSAFRFRSSFDLEYVDARPWLFGIARNALRNHWRTRPNDDRSVDVSTLAIMSDPWPGVDERIDGESIIRRALDTLPADEREIVSLVVWEQLSIVGAGRALGVPDGTAWRLLHQARNSLRNEPGMASLLAQSNQIKETNDHR